jgi:hypothetical protein
MPQLYTLNSQRILSGTLHMPRAGAWHGDFELDAQERLTGAANVDFDGLRFTGTVVRGDVVAGRGAARIVGGRGGLSKDVPALSYRNVQARMVIADLLSAVGEELASSSDEVLLSAQLDHWTRPQGAAGSALSKVVDTIGGVWRVLADGTVWVGAESYPEQSVAHQPLDPDPLQGAFAMAPVSPSLRPGVTFEGTRVSRVEHQIDGGKLRTIYWAEEERPDGTPALRDRVKDQLSRFIRWVMRDVTYHKLYPSQVQRQDASGLLDLLPDDESIRGTGTSGVQIRHGLPGCTVKVRPGARVLLGFENGDPRRPYAALWEEGDIISVSLGFGGSRPVARIGDTVSVFFPPTIPVSGTLSGAPFSGVLTITTAAPGIIDGSGNPKVLA